MPYALFDHDVRIGESASTELGAWQNALRAGLISDIPVADEQGGQVLPRGLTVKRMDEMAAASRSEVLTSRRPCDSKQRPVILRYATPVPTSDVHLSSGPDRNSPVWRRFRKKFASARS